MFPPFFYIIVNKNDNTSSQTGTEIVNTNSINKVIKISIKKINEKIVNISEYKNIIFDNYKWFYFHPNIYIDFGYIYYQTFINHDFTCEVIKDLLNVDLIHSKKITEYYYTDFKLSNLISIGNIFDNMKSYFNDLEILKSNSYSDGFFEYITKKYSTNEDNKIFEILTILFNNYSYPLKNTRHDLDNVFDHLLYFSL